MARAEWAAVLSGGYLAAVFAWHRLRLRRKRREGPPLERLARFDHRALWDELAERDWLGQKGAPAPLSEAPTCPRFYRESPWELAEPPELKPLRDALFAGANLPLPASDRAPLWLMTHTAVRRALAGDLDGAAALAALMPESRGGRLLVLLDLARAERAQAVRESARARGFALAALARANRLAQTSPSAGLVYLAAHVRLSYLTHPLNLELSVVLAIARLRAALRRFGEAPWLHLALARAQAMLGRHEEALDELGRALYHAQGDPFYAEAILAGGFAEARRPALAARCRELLAARAAGPR